MMHDPGDAVDPHAPAGDAPSLQEMLEHIPATVYVITNQVPPSMLYVNEYVEWLTGYPRHRWIDDPELWMLGTHPDDRELVIERWSASVRDAIPFQVEYRMIRPDGSIVWVRDNASPVRGPDGDVAYWQGVTHDVTERRAAEDALTRSEARYRALVERLPAVVYVDSDEVTPRSLYVSPNVEDIIGHSPDAYLADPDLWPRTIHEDDRERISTAWAAVIESHEPFHAEYRIVRPDGSIVWVRDSSLPVRDDDGLTLFWQGVLMDITAQKEAEDELRLSSSRHRFLVEQIPAVVYEMDQDDERRTLYVSPHVEEILGYDRQEWLDQPDIWTELLHPDDRETELAAHDRHTKSGETWQREYRLIASDGRTVWVRDQARLVRDAASGIFRWQGVMLDITLQKNAERGLRDANDELEFRVLARTTELAEANEMMSLEIGERRRIEAELRETEHRYRALVEDMPAAVFMWVVGWDEETGAPDGPQPYMSPQIETILGYTASQFQREGFWQQRVHPHDIDRVEALAQRSAETGEPFNVEYRYLAKDGSIVWVLERATLLQRDGLGMPSVFQGVMLDVTGRKLAEEKALEVEGRYRRLAEEGPVMSYIGAIDQEAEPPSMHIEYVSPQTADLVGYPLEYWLDRLDRWFGMIHPDDRDVVASVTRDLASSGEPWSIHYRVIGGDGGIIWLHDQGKVVERDTAGRPTRFQGVLLDMTQDRAERHELQTSERRFRELVEKAPGVAWTQIVDQATGHARYSYIGPQSVELFGYTAEELLNEPGHFERMVHPDDLDRVMAGSRRADRALTPWEDQYRVLTRDGGVRVVHASARPGPVDPVTGSVTWYGVTIDVTEARVPSDLPEA
jgi:PAS domain S-box-containing protein